MSLLEGMGTGWGFLSRFYWPIRLETQPSDKSEQVDLHFDAKHQAPAHVCEIFAPSHFEWLWGSNGAGEANTGMFKTCSTQGISTRQPRQFQENQENLPWGV